MACCNSKTPYAKSCIRVRNSTSQTLSATTPTTLVLQGTPVTDSGCSLTLNPSSITVNKSGLYHFAADVTVNPIAAGTAVIQLFKDGVPLLCAVATVTATTDSIFTAHVETDLCLNACCANNPTIAVVVSGVAGTVTNLCVGALKLA